MDTLFSKKRDTENHQQYNRLIESEVFLSIRDYIDSIWCEYQKYADKHFSKEFPKNTNQRLWEMFLTIALSRKNDISRTLIGNGPDISISKSKTYYIEAVCPKRGNNQENSPKFCIGVFEEVKQDRLELRIQNAISEKMEKYDEYITKGIISRSDPYIIAISLAEFPESDIFSQPDSIPLVISSVYPIGGELASFDLESGKYLSSSFEFKKDNTKENDSTVSKTIFMNSDFNYLSGILFCNSSFNIPVENMYNDLFLLKNEYAINKLDNNFFVNECIVHISKMSISITYKKNA